VPYIPPLARNLAILAVIALALTLAGGTSGRVFDVLFMIVNIAFALALLWFGINLYRRNRGTFDLMPASRRYALYASAGALLLLIVTSWAWVSTPLAALAFFALIGGLGYAVWWLWQDSRRYYY
jgi:hypothetical protein